MTWWKKALYDTCSLLTLDHLFPDHQFLGKLFPRSIRALEQSFDTSQLRPKTAVRIQARVSLCPLPPASTLQKLISSRRLPCSLAALDKLLFAAAVHNELSVVTASRQLAIVVQKKGLKVGCVATILRECVESKQLSRKSCESVLLAFGGRHNCLLGIPGPKWKDLREYEFPS